MNGVAIIKNESGGNRHAERGEVTNGPAKKGSKQEEPENGDQAYQDDRNAQRPEIAAEQV